MSDWSPELLKMKEQRDALRARVAGLEFTLSSTEGHRQGLMANVADLRAQLAAAQRERDLAVAHDRQPYPTAEAYEKVCAVLATREADLAEAARHVAAVLDAAGPCTGGRFDAARAWLASRGGGR